VLRSVAEFGNLSAVAHSDFLAVVDEDECIGCGDCVELCQFGALSVPDYVSVVDSMRCMGCGICITGCSSETLRLERRPADDVLPLPQDLEAWKAQRLQNRKIAISDTA
jgi:heterodisulfide reductase subunit A-like polyferredoxin